MDEIRFRRRLPSALLIANLVPLAALGVACGGSSTADAPRDTASGGQADHGGGAAGSAAASGRVGDVAGSAGAGTAGGNGGAGNSGGSAGVSGGGASAGSGGVSGGVGGGSSGAAGMAGSSGNSAVCHARPPQVCAGGPITLPKTCVAEAVAQAGSSLPTATCQAMCESMFAFSCAISDVQQTTITVQCVTGCPASKQ